MIQQVNLSLTKSNVLESAQTLKNFTGDGKILKDKMDIAFISQTIYNYLGFVSREKEVLLILYVCI